MQPFGRDPVRIYLMYSSIWLRLGEPKYLHSLVVCTIQPSGYNVCTAHTTPSSATWRNDRYISLGDLSIHNRLNLLRTCNATKLLILDNAPQPKIRQFKLIVGPIFRFRAADCTIHTTYVAIPLYQRNELMVDLYWGYDCGIDHKVWSVGASINQCEIRTVNLRVKCILSRARQREDRFINISHLPRQHTTSQFRRLRTRTACLSGEAWFSLIADQ